MENKYGIEICVASVESAIAAKEGMADRVELCDNLFEGGTTPSIGMTELVRNKIDIDVFVMIRPRGGDFLYSNLEFEVMKHDINAAKKIGANGVVFGILTEDGNVDYERMLELINLSRPLEVTFHRAIDMVSCPEKALDTIIKLGCNRVLTAGRANKAIDGKDEIKRMVNQANGEIKIMAGSGINEENVQILRDYTGVREFHLSGKKNVPGKMKYRNNSVFMGGLPEIPEYDIITTDSNKIKNIHSILK